MIRFEHVDKYFNGTAVIRDLSLSIPRGKITVLIGSSGSGKSTTLKMINRLIEHDAGRIFFEGQEIRSFKPETLRRRMGYAIQSIGLFPHWTVAQNIATVPSLEGWSKEQINQRVNELLTLLNLEPNQYRHRYPHELSGGQQQRVGVARAMAADPDILLMDEPFGALDPVTRKSLQDEVRRIQSKLSKTILLVTHDMDEALSLADHLVIMQEGSVVQQGTPLHIVSQPKNDFVRDFIGSDDLGIKYLGLHTVNNRVRLGEIVAGVPILDSLTLKEAMSVFVERRTKVLSVADVDNNIVGSLHFDDLVLAE